LKLYFNSAKHKPHFKQIVHPQISNLLLACVRPFVTVRSES
jgi:uncharacterized pyridoxamine 5'-phosphate oxidase family protein